LEVKRMLEKSEGLGGGEKREGRLLMKAALETFFLSPGLQYRVLPAVYCYKL
jgi:hypothetical protein